MSERRRLRVAPPEGVVAASAVTQGQGSLISYHSVRLDQWPDDTAQLGARTVLDPPWVKNIVPGELPTDERNAPPNQGVPQHATCIELVHARRSRVLIDGVPVVNTGNRNKFYLPRFREQSYQTKYNTFTQEENEDDARTRERTRTRRVVAPVYVSMRLEDGETRPQKVEVLIRQSIYDDGVEVMDADDSTSIVARYEIKPYSVVDHAMDVIAVPYPAWITRTPSLRIIDNDSLRKWKIKKEQNKAGRFYKVISSSVAALIDWAGIINLIDIDATGALGGIAKYIIGVAGSGKARNLWRWLFLSVSPFGQRAYDVVAAYWDFAFQNFSNKLPPPQAEAHDIPLPSAIKSIERFIATRSNGSLEKDRTVGMTPAQMSQKGWRADGALWDYLIYGPNKRSNPRFFRRFLDPLDVVGSVEESTGINITDPLGIVRQSLPGNELDVRGMDPFFCAESRCEFRIEIVVTNTDGKKTTYQFDALRANGLDAGIVMCDYEFMRSQFAELAETLIKRLTALRSIAPLNWLTNRLYITDTKSWFTLNPRRWLGVGRKEATSQRWSAYTSEERRKELDKVHKNRGSPLIIDVKAMQRRLTNDIVGKVEDERTRKKRRSASIIKPLPDRRTYVIPESVKLPTTMGATAAQYNAYIAASTELYRAAYGLGDYPLYEDEADVVRWRDIYCPYIPERFDARLGWYIVPLPRDKARTLAEGAVVRRLPQIATLVYKRSNTIGAPVLTVRGVEQDSLSERTGAKSAVDASKVVWRMTSYDFREIVWTLEPGTSGPLAYHAIEICASMPQTLLPEPNLDVNWHHYLRIASINSHVQPVDVGKLVYRFDLNPDTTLAEGQEAFNGSAPQGDARVLALHRLPPTLVSWYALLGVANAIAYAAIQRGVQFELQDTINNAVVRARAAAYLAADIIDRAYGTSLKTGTLLPYNDSVWVCAQQGGLAHAIIRQMPTWNNVQGLYAGGSTLTEVEFEAVWPRTAREQATLYAHALRVLSRASKFDISQWPFTFLQSLVVSRPLLPVSLNTDAIVRSGLEMQINAAVASFMRVRRLLMRSDVTTSVHGLWALADVVASRPVLLQFARREYAGQAKLLTTVSLFGAQYSWKQPEPKDNTRAISSLMAARTPALLRLMGDLTLDDLKGKQPIDILAQELVASTPDFDPADRLLIPPCGTGAAGMLDVSNSSALEDTIVWLDAVDREISKLLAGASMINSRDARGSEETIWRFEFDEHTHPYTIRVRKGKGAVQALKAVPERPPEKGVLLGLPATVLETCEMLKQRPLDEQPTGTFASRRRAMLWLTDRLLQLQLVAIGARERSQQVQRVRCLMPVNNAGAAFVAVALAVATSVRDTQTAWVGKMRLEFDPIVDLASVKTALRNAQRLLRPLKGENAKDPIRAMPLSELSHVLAAALE